jgi:outer membrane protein insertion porin family
VRGLAVALATAALVGVLWVPGAAEPPIVASVELASPHRLPEDRIRAALGDLVGRPLSRTAVRASLERLWTMQLFASIQVDELVEPSGVRLRYTLARRPLIRRIVWDGESGLDPADVVTTAALAIGEEASPARLARAHRDLLTRYRREGYLAARVRIDADPVADTNERDLVVVLDAGERARLGAVRLRVEPGLDEGEVRDALKLREGHAYTELLVRDAVRAAEDRLRRDGRYQARVTVGPPAWDPAQNRVDLDVAATVGPLFRVEFEGRLALGDKTLRARLTFPRSGITDRFEQEASARELEALYREHGYHFAAVEPDEARDGDTHVIRFAIREGPRVSVESVTFTGNFAVPTERLAKAIETRPPGLFVRGLFRQDVVDRDVRVLVALFRNEGYPEVKVGPAEVAFSEDRSRARVVVPVADGPRLTVGAIDVEGARILSVPEITAALGLVPGAPWVRQRAEDAVRAIERLYAGRGHHGAVVRLETRRRDSMVDVRYTLEEGEATRIGRILVRGLLLTREDIVRRDLPFASGDLLTPDRLLEGQRRLGDRTAFASVSIDPLRPPATAFADVEVTLRERKPWRLDFGLGYGNKDGGRVFVEVGHDNVFGTGSSVSLRQRVSGGGDSVGFSERTDLLARSPRIFGSAWWLDLDLFQEWSKQLGYDLGQYGLWAGVHRDLFRDRIKGLRGDLRYRFEVARYSNVDTSLAAADVTPGTTVISSVTSMLTLDRRDVPVDPARGSLHMVSLESGLHAIGSEIEFIKARFETRWFLDWPPPTLFVVAGRLGIARALGSTTALAIQDRFFAGGTTTIRGYRDDRVGPLDAKGNPTGGNGLAILNLEWRFPIWGWIGGALFVDTGAVTPEFGDLNLDAFRTGTGLGVRVKTPVGPLRVDVGYALQPIPGDRRVQFHFSVGNPF